MGNDRSLFKLSLSDFRDRCLIMFVHGNAHNHNQSKYNRRIKSRQKKKSKIWLKGRINKNKDKSTKSKKETQQKQWVKYIGKERDKIWHPLYAFEYYFVERYWDQWRIPTKMTKKNE